jgi:hypothetical protein
MGSLTFLLLTLFGLVTVAGCGGMTSGGILNRLVSVDCGRAAGGGGVGLGRYGGTALC